jgi:hypothetical protein
MKEGDGKEFFKEKQQYTGKFHLNHRHGVGKLFVPESNVFLNSNSVLRIKDFKIQKTRNQRRRLHVHRRME